VIYKRLDTDGGCLTVVGDLLVGDLDVIKVFESLRGFPEGKTEVHVKCQAQGHDMGIELAEFEGGGVFGKGIQVHLKEIYREFTVDIMEFVFVFAVILF